MKIHQTLAATLVVLAALGVSAANASTVLSDDFDSLGQVAQSNWSGDAVFLSIPQPGNIQNLPSVDLVGPGYFDNLAYSTGNSVDLDGSTGSGDVPAGEIQSIASLASGDYTVSFLLAGNLRSAADQVTAVSIGGTTVDVTPSSNSQGYTPYTLYFTGVSGQLAFTDLGPSDQQGDLLDNVVVTTGVPEPATWAMMLMGFGAVGFMMRGSRRKQAGVLA
jgi:hypothetical protein